MAQITTAERLARLRLARTNGIGPVTFKRLIDRYGSAQTALEAIPDLSRNGGRKTPLTPCPQNVAQTEWDKLQSMDGTLLVLGEPDYPAHLSAIEDAPCTLSIIGDTSFLHRPQIAVVGSRNASLQGRKITADISTSLGKSGYAITSGLARGIDTAAHTAALPTGTIAVVAGGVDVIYPTENSALYHDIASRGAIVSENALGTQPTNMHFPRRNRIISGLSLGTLIVEAALKSGSLITATFAADQGREVFAIPGHPYDPRAAGPNALIRDGATLVTHANDILQNLNTRTVVHEPANTSYTHAPTQIDDNTLQNARNDIIPLLGTMRVSVDDLIRETGIPAPIIHTVLLELELADRLIRHPGNQVSASHFDDPVDKPHTFIY